MASRDSLPELSLAIAVYGGGGTHAYEDWLDSLDEASLRRIELIFASSAPLSFRAPPGVAVCLIERPGETPVRLWGAAVAAARGRHVCVLDAHAAPAAGWLEAILEAVQGSGDRFWGPVVCDYAAGDRRMIGYLTEYVQFHPPIADTLREIPGNNLVIPNPGEAAYEDLLTKGFSKTAMLESWARDPDSWPVRVDGARVTHRRALDRAAYVVRRYRHGRSYGGNRATRAGLAKRLRLAAPLVALPVVRVGRIGMHARATRFLFGAFVRHLPSILAAETAWSLGEFAGTLFGAGSATDRLD